jgi:hypothetical protein
MSFALDAGGFFIMARLITLRGLDRPSSSHRTAALGIAPARSPGLSAASVSHRPQGVQFACPARTVAETRLGQKGAQFGAWGGRFLHHGESHNAAAKEKPRRREHCAAGDQWSRYQRPLWRSATLGAGTAYKRRPRSEMMSAEFRNLKLSHSSNGPAVTMVQPPPLASRAPRPHAGEEIERSARRPLTTPW